MKQPKMPNKGEMLKFKKKFETTVLPEYQKLKAMGGTLTAQQERIVARAEAKKKE